MSDESLDIFNIIQQISCSVNETQESFIFDVLNKFAQEHYNITVDKYELCMAIQLVRMYRKYGTGISEIWDTATRNEAEIRSAYDRGYRDGVENEHSRMVANIEKNKILDNE